MNPLFEEAKKNYFPEWDRKCKERMEIGAIAYGDVSFSNPIMQTIIEIQEELEDVRNWAGIAWVKLEKLKESELLKEQK